MPYSRGYRRRTRTGRRPTRRTRIPLRRYRRRAVGSRRRPRYGASRRRILNISSVKKQDNMESTVTSTGGGGPTSGGYGYSAFGSTGAVTPGVFIWCATARDRVSNLSPGDPNASSVRTADSIYVRGLKETVLVQTNSQVPWRWRRICFTAKGLYSSLGGSVDAVETSSGWVRMVSEFTGTPWWNFLRALIFKGNQGTDWNELMSAKTDSNRITVISDITRTIQSGNNYGVLRKYKQWIPLNKTLVYANDEQGETETSDFHSTLGRAGMGDLYIVDIVYSHSAATASDSLLFEPQATMYWHER